MAGIFNKLKKALSRTSDKISDGISAVIKNKKIDDNTISELEEILILSDVDPNTAIEITTELSKTKLNKDLLESDVKHIFAQKIIDIISPFSQTLEKFLSNSEDGLPKVILLCGVNGSGKTTVAAKLGAFLQKHGKKVRMAACDTFRAAAVEQLQFWGRKLDIPVEYSNHGSDSASLAFDAYVSAKKFGDDVLIIDTAGRLHNRDDLMSELEKIKRVIGKQDVLAPQETILILDATTGQTAINQVREFASRIGVTGLIITKLDGTAKAGALISVAKTFKLPILGVGVGEKADDLCDFSAKEYAAGLLGIDIT